jgi:hypothetical protein
MASWLTLIKKYPYVFDQKLRAQGLEPTDENRMGEMWFNMTKDTMESLVMARHTSRNMIEVNYDLFMEYPKECLRGIEDFLELEKFDYNFDKIEKLEEDNDLKAWGFPELHKIRHTFGKTSKPAIEVLGEDLYSRFVEIEKQYV